MLFVFEPPSLYGHYQVFWPLESEKITENWKLTAGHGYLNHKMIIAKLWIWSLGPLLFEHIYKSSNHLKPPTHVSPPANTAMTTNWYENAPCIQHCNSVPYKWISHSCAEICFLFFCPNNLVIWIIRKNKQQGPAWLYHSAFLNFSESPLKKTS